MLQTLQRPFRKFPKGFFIGKFLKTRRTNQENPDYDICKDGMADMNIMKINYNFIAYFESILRLHCNMGYFMTIIKSNFAKTSNVQPFKASFG